MGKKAIGTDPRSNPDVTTVVVEESGPVLSGRETVGLLGLLLDASLLWCISSSDKLHLVQLAQMEVAEVWIDFINTACLRPRASCFVLIQEGLAP